MAISRLTASLFSASNENTIALANLNFDFTLIKYQVPPEFETLGETLSLKRRKDAEEGPVHQTARRLGALFEKLVPPTPKLIKAYGLRASEIASAPGVNPRGTRNDGPFQAFIGADGTSLWAAATSERNNAHAHAPLAMHLLACMLARAWDPDKANAIWVEIVNERQKEIDVAMDSEPQLESACWAARQKISRKQLGAWDASARAWLRSADEARVSDRTKLALIMKNLTLPVNHARSTYDNVINVWRDAMTGMEKLVDGMPQQLSNGSILLALSAWHLFPDLIVLGESTKYVSFGDNLVRKGGTITVGLHSAPDAPGEGMQWSLALSHFRYYGDAITVKTEPDTLRVTIEQLLLVLFGSVLSSWGISPKKQTDTADWLVALKGFLAPIEHSGQDSQQMIPMWLEPILEAAECFLRFEKEDYETTRMLVSWGRRRAKNFLDLRDYVELPFFGLSNSLILVALCARNEVEVAIDYFRAMAKDLGLETGDAIIQYKKVWGYIETYEYATAVPHLSSSPKRSHDGVPKPELVHYRWLFNSCKLPNVPYQVCECVDLCTEECSCKLPYSKCNEFCHTTPKRRCQTSGIGLERRAEEIQSFGEYCQFATAFDFFHGSEGSYHENFVHLNGAQKPLNPHAAAMLGKASFFWQNPPYVFHSRRLQTPPYQSCPSLSGTQSRCTCFEPLSGHMDFLHNSFFELCNGEANGFALFVRAKGSVSQGGPSAAASIASRLSTMKQRHFDPIEGAKLFKANNSTNRRFIWDHIACLTRSVPLKGSRSLSGAESLLSKYPLPRTYLRSLSAFQFARSIYKDLVGATISLRVTSLSLNDAKYFRKPVDNLDLRDDGILKAIEDFSAPGLDVESISRAQKFSCIALFESGIHNLESDVFEPVFAMAYANSIFVATELLCDPLDEAFGKNGVRRIVGNIGRPGVSLMVFPQQPARLRPLKNDYRIVPHIEYDLKRENNFYATTLHLSFTEWKRSVNISTRGAIDEEVSIIESVISVHDRGGWVADLNAILEMIPQELELNCICEGLGDAENLTSIDDWEELLDPPDNLGIFRANKNWAARLAAATIREQQGHEYTTLLIRPDSNICGKCLAIYFLHETGKRAGMIID